MFLINFLHLLLFIASSLFTCRVRYVFRSLRVFFGLPVDLTSSASQSVCFYVVILFFLRCPCCLNLFHHSSVIVSSVLKLCLTLYENLWTALHKTVCCAGLDATLWLFCKKNSLKNFPFKTSQLLFSTWHFFWQQTHSWKRHSLKSRKLYHSFFLKPTNTGNSGTTSTLSKPFWVITVIAETWSLQGHMVNQSDLHWHCSLLIGI